MAQGRIAQLMGGDVGYESTPGKGSCFWLTAMMARGTQLIRDDLRILPP